MNLRLARLAACLGCGLVVGMAACRSSKPSGEPPQAQTGGQADPALMKVDVHMHIELASGDQALALMRASNVVVGLNASGGTPTFGLPESKAFEKSSAGRLRPYCNIDLGRAGDPGFAAYAERTVRACKELGALGLKIPKLLGLGVTGIDQKLIPVDDARFDPIFVTAGAVGLPVLIHVADPKAFFRAPSTDNERYDELVAHPAWSFFGKTPDGEPWPSWESMLEAFERRVARHPQTRFLGAHFGNAAEEPERVARMLDRYPNYFIDTAARVPEFGRHSADKMRQLFIRYQDRILFGSDLAVNQHGVVLGSSGRSMDSAAGAPQFFNAHWLYFETRRRGLAHPTPIQGKWTVDGIGLPKDVLEKLYWGNANRLFSLGLSREQMRPRGN